MQESDQGPRSPGYPIPARTIGGGRGDSEAVSRPAPAATDAAPVRAMSVAPSRTLSPPWVRKVIVLKMVVKRVTRKLPITGSSDRIRVAPADATALAPPPAAGLRTAGIGPLKPTLPPVQTHDSASLVDHPAPPKALTGVSPLAVAAAQGCFRNEATAENRLEQREVGSSEANAASPAPASRARTSQLTQPPPPRGPADGAAARPRGASARRAGARCRRMILSAS